MHAITFDNDKGFADHMTVANTLDMSTYFPGPFTSQDKGMVENKIGQIRKFFPKRQTLVLQLIIMRSVLKDY